MYFHKYIIYNPRCWYVLKNDLLKIFYLKPCSQLKHTKNIKWNFHELIVKLMCALKLTKDLKFIISERST